MSGRGLVRIDPTQAAVVGALAGDGPLVVVEGAAGAGKTTALRSTQELLSQRGRRLMVVTPTLKAAEVAAAETGADGHSAAWLIHQHGWRWDADGHWTRQPNPTPEPGAELRPGDLLLVDEAGMLDQDTARALLTIADETGARVAFVGDRHQLPAVGRGGDAGPCGRVGAPDRRGHPGEGAPVHRPRLRRAESADAHTATTPEACSTPWPAALRSCSTPPRWNEPPRWPTPAPSGDLVIADTREHVAELNAAIRDRTQRDEDTAWELRLRLATGSGSGTGSRPGATTPICR